MMQQLTEIIDTLNHYLWGYILIAMLLGCAVWFTVKSRFVQFTMFGEMFRLLVKSNSRAGSEHVSSFQAFAISLASRVGTGNLAGVATAITLGGAGAVFWMWIIALFGAANAFVESTLAQLYKSKSEGDGLYIGGPAYYMQRGLGKRWLGVIFAVLITITFGFAFNSVQSNTICAAFDKSFGIDHTVMGVVLTVITLAVIFGGLKRIASISSVIVPFMALGYIVMALVVVILNIDHLPEVVEHIVKSAMGFEQAMAGGIGAAVMQGIKRGLFSNEAGMGSAPNAAATADVAHPVAQGLVQTLGVFTDTLLICSCTAFIILFSGVPTDGAVDGINLTQQALSTKIGDWGAIFVSVAILLFAYSSIIGNYYYGESNIRFITQKRWVLQLYRLFVGGMVMFGSVATLRLVWNFADITMALMTICNLVAMIWLGHEAIILLKDYRRQRAQGVKEPVYVKSSTPEIAHKVELWE